MTVKDQKMKIPKTVGAAIDLLDATRDRRKVLEAQANAVKTEEVEIETQIFALFKKSDLDGGRGKRAQASVSTSDVPVLDDEKKFFTFFWKEKDSSLLQRRLSVEAIRERWAAKKTIPGVGVFTKVRLHLTKLKK